MAEKQGKEVQELEKREEELKVKEKHLAELQDWLDSKEKGLAERERALPLVCLLYTSPSPRDRTRSRMPSSA